MLNNDSYIDFMSKNPNKPINMVENHRQKKTIIFKQLETKETMKNALSLFL